MIRLYRTAVAGLAMSGMLSLMLSPAAAQGQKPGQSKPATTTNKATTKTTTTKTTPTKATQTKTVPAKTTPVKTMPAKTVPVKAAPVKTHMTPAKPATSHATTAKPSKAMVTHPAPVKRNMGAVKMTPQAVTKVRAASMIRIKTIGHAATRISHVTIVQRPVFARIKVKRAKLRNVTFLTGVVVSRTPSVVMLRTADGTIVPVTVNNITIVRNVLVPGETVVVPAQFVSNGFVLVPAFAKVDEDDFDNEPVLAPCATNDRDGDDAGDASNFAPFGSCSINDGDGDDGFVIPALPASFGTIPTMFSSAFQPVLATGVVVAQNGNNVVLLTPNFTPLVVNASPAIASGATNGALTPGRFVTVYGFDFNNTLVATSLM